MHKLDIKKFLLGFVSLFNIFLLISVFNSTAFAEIVDCRFIKNQKFKKEVVRYISKDELNFLYKCYGKHLSDLTVDMENMIFVVDPMNISTVEVEIPLLDCNDSKIFGSVGLLLECCQCKLNIPKLLSFFTDEKHKLTYNINEENSIYSIFGVSNPVKYKKMDNLNDLDKRDLTRRIYLSYPECGGESGLVQILNNGEQYFYSIHSDKLKKLI